VHRALRGDSLRLVASITYKCSRGEGAPSVQAPEKVPKRSAKVGCLFQVQFQIYARGGAEAATEVRIQETFAHNGHEPGSAEDALLLRPARALEERAAELLALKLRPMQVKILRSLCCLTQVLRAHARSRVVMGVPVITTCLRGCSFRVTCSRHP
jgi:hypothetical protein